MEIFKKILKVIGYGIWELVVLAFIVYLFSDEQFSAPEKIIICLIIAFFAGIIPFAIDWKLQHNKQVRQGVPKKETTIYKNPFKRIVSSLYGVIFIVLIVVLKYLWKEGTKSCGDCIHYHNCLHASDPYRTGINCPQFSAKRKR